MSELLKNAWSGWLNYTDNGKYAALLLVVLLFLWLRKGHRNKDLLIYTSIATVICIFPVTAAVLMKYQTHFYDYEWIWNIVPVTMVIAYGITVFLTGRWKSYEQEVRQKGNTVTKKLFWENIGVTAGVVAVVLLCGRLGNPVFVAEQELAERAQVEVVLEVLKERWAFGGLETQEQVTASLLEQGNVQLGVAQNLVLWAPQEVMAYARAYDGNIRLIYGRNMWDKSLMGYSYEQYGDVEESLYLWMTSVEENPDQSREEFLEGGVSCVEAALERGVNCIMLPSGTSQENVAALEEVLGQKAEVLKGYYVFYEL